MSDKKAALSGPDLANGIALHALADGPMLLGHAHGEPVLRGVAVNEARDCSVTYSRGGRPQPQLEAAR